MTRFLYRGVRSTNFSVAGALCPKERTPFLKPPKWNISEWGSSWNASERNAVNEHQHGQLGLPTSGISTTPHLSRAEFYALGKEQIGCGYVVVLDRDRCKANNVREFVVSDLVHHPAVPEDDEVILVVDTLAHLPEAIVVEIKKVCA